MKLADYLYNHNKTPRELRLILGVSRSTMSRYLRNQRVPRSNILQQLHEMTHGLVRREDFFDLTPPDCARVTRRADGSIRWILPWSSGKLDLEPLYSSRVSSPVLRAIQTLNGRARLTLRGTYLLDGRVSDPKRIVVAANEILRREGEDPIKYPIVEPIYD